MKANAPKRHYIALAGEFGYLPDYCDVFETKRDAIESLAELHKLGRRAKRELRADNYTALTRYADYCEIQVCGCGNPKQHSGV